MPKNGWKFGRKSAAVAAWLGAFGLMMASPAAAGEPCTTATCTPTGMPCQQCDAIFSDAGRRLTDDLARLNAECCTQASACCPTDACVTEGCTTEGCVSEGCTAEAEEEELGCLMSLFSDECGNNHLADAGFTLGGWISQGYTYNPDRPADGTNGPVTFNDQANQYQLNQVYLYLEKAVDRDACEWSLGGRVDLLYGSDFIFTTATGLETEQDGTQRWNQETGDNRAIFGPAPEIGLAMPQLYAEIGGQGLSVKIGHFYTIIGYEVVTAPQNFFYSHAYTMQYGEPFTHTGALATYSLTDRVSVSGGITNGWDNFDNSDDNYNFLGGITWTSESEATSLAFAVTSGDEPSFANFDNRSMYSIVLTQKLTEKTTYVLQHDNGIQQNALAGGQDAEWYGLNNYLFYDVTEKVAAGVRAEWFRDDDGARLGNGAVDYYELTGGVNWKPTDNLVVRPEVRYDYSDGANVYDTGTSNDQVLVGADVIFTY